MKTFKERIIEEAPNFDSLREQAIDHLWMAESILFEEFDGRYNKFQDKIQEIINELS